MYYSLEVTCTTLITTTKALERNTLVNTSSQVHNILFSIARERSNNMRTYTTVCSSNPLQYWLLDFEHSTTQMPFSVIV